MTHILRSRWRELLGAVVTVALGVACFFAQQNLHNLRERTSDGKAAVKVAEAQVLGLTTLDPDNVNRQLASLRGRTTGDFRRQFEGILDTFVAVVKRDKITSEGKIAAAGLEKLDADHAVVLVASKATVRNATGKDPQTRHYRMRLKLVKADGNWAVKGMEFVA